MSNIFKDLEEAYQKDTDEAEEIALAQWRKYLKENPRLFQQGGRGSGNTDHKGRPGKVGGSLPKGQSKKPSNIKVPKILYHMTTQKNWKSIQKHGLRATDDYILEGMEEYDKPGVNLIDDPDNVFFPDRKDTVWLIIDTSKLDHSDFWNSDEWFRYGKSIPTSAIRVMKKNEKFFVQGGPGSGNFDHEGRPGQVGGSQSKGEASVDDEDYSRVKLVDVAQRVGQARTSNFWVSPDGSKVIGETHSGDQHYEISDLIVGRGETTYSSYNEYLKRGAIRLGIDRKSTSIETHSLDTQTLKRIQKLADDGRINLSDQIEWGGLTRGKGEPLQGVIVDTYENFMSADSVAYDQSSFPSLLIKNKKLFVQGGPGSGNFGHRGRPGEVGGSAKEGGISPSKLDDWGDERQKREELKERMREVAKKEFDDEAFHRKRVEDVCEKLGYPKSQVESTTREGEIFTVGGYKFKTGADYNPQTGAIRVFDVDEMSNPQLEGIMAHEIQHSRWETFHQEFQSQAVEIGRMINSAKTEDLSPVNADGLLKNAKDRKKYWAYDIQSTYMMPYSTGWTLLRFKDGVSDYSRAYWKQFESDGSLYSFDRAVDETLAEIARHETQSSSPGINSIWEDLYGKIKKRKKATHGRS